MRMKILSSMIIGLGIGLVAANADLIVADSTPANDRADLQPAAGQTFTTGVLGENNLLLSIEIQGPRDAPGATHPLGPFYLEVWTDTDGDFQTWDPGTLVGASLEANSIQVGDGVNPGPLSMWTFDRPTLADNAVYAFTYTAPDGSGTLVAARMGLTNVEGIRLEDGALFSGGVQPFGGVYDTSMRITTTVIPEPSAALLLLAGGAGLAALRRRTSR
jgi:hypothetical protein